MSRGKVVIVEDEFFVAEHLTILVEEQGFEVTGEYHSGEEFMTNTDWDFDIALLDIFLSGEITGISIAAEVKKRKKPFAFITANKDAETLKHAAKLQPAAYISKPFQTNDVIAALEIVAYQLPKRLKVNTRHGVLMISPHDIVFIKSDGAYVEIYTETETIVQRKLLKDIESELPESFVRVHRSYLVNKHYIDKKTSSYLTLLTHQIPISRSYKDNLDGLQ